jgi:hypothetical protein
MSDLYEDDALACSTRQAALLRRMAAGERVNDQVDWENVAEEIASVGNEQVHAVRSLLIQAFLHDLKAEAWPLARDVPNWRADARGSRTEAADRFTPSMRQKVDLPGLYRRALRRLPETMGGQAPLPVPTECQVASVEELFRDPADE